jgi:chemotaxis protein methyltransferase CheR
VTRRLPKNPHLRTLEQALAERFGWQPGGAVREAVVAAVAGKADRLGLDEVSYCRMAALSGGELQALAEEVAPADSRFFRDEAQAEALRERVLPELIAARSAERRLRIWSVACATGEEAFSLAMLVREVLPPDSSWRVDILASDLRGQAIMAGTRGRFHASAVRGLDPTLRHRYFIGIDEPSPDRELELLPLVRRMVTFRRANVCEPHIWRQLPGACDLIVCQHLLLYFHRQAVENTVERLAGALAVGAYLAVGAAEAGLLSHPLLRPVESLPAGFCRRGE